MPPRKPDADSPFDDERGDDELDALDIDELDDLDARGFDLFDADDLVGRLLHDEPYRADADEPIFAAPAEDLLPDQGRSRRALLGVPEFDDDEGSAPYSPLTFHTTASPTGQTP
jgi:hypothetical protein